MQNEYGDGLADMGKNLATVRSSFKDLVVYNDQGQPTIDINRLVYKPKTKTKGKLKEKLSWYLPDYVFVIFNFLSLTYSTFYFINGLTIISWRNSMQIFRIDPADCKVAKTDDNVDICNIITTQYEEEDMSPFTMIRFYGFTDSSSHGLVLVTIGLINYGNILVGINACIDGSRRLLFAYLVVDAILLVFEVLMITVLHLSGICDPRDIEIIRVFLQRHLDNYAKDLPDTLVKTDTIELDFIQISLTCCGVGNWTDYLPRSTWNETSSGGENETSAAEMITRETIQRYTLDKADMIIPASCCRQWWVRNIYCAHEVHLWAYPTTTAMQAHQVRQRISQWGCLPKMVGLCKNIVVMAGVGGMAAWAVHCFLSVVRFVCGITQIERNSTMALEKSGKMRKKKKGVKLSADVGEEEDDTNVKFPSISTLFGISSGSEDIDDVDKSELPLPPKEKEIAEMKSRRDFNRIQSAMKNTHVENWLQSGRSFVEGTDDIRKPHGAMGGEHSKNGNKPTRKKEEANIWSDGRPNSDDSADGERNTFQALKMFQSMANR